MLRFNSLLLKEPTAKMQEPFSPKSQEGIHSHRFKQQKTGETDGDGYRKRMT